MSHTDGEKARPKGDYTAFITKGEGRRKKKKNKELGRDFQGEKKKMGEFIVNERPAHPGTPNTNPTR